MLFDLRMQVPLHMVKQQRLDLARLGTDLQAASGLVFEVVFETLPNQLACGATRYLMPSVAGRARDRRHSRHAAAAHEFEGEL
jgi:hypothetical protein